MRSKNDNQLASFMNYCYRHPEERFWQALRNWAEVGFIYTQASGSRVLNDTFYLEDGDMLK